MIDAPKWPVAPWVTAAFFVSLLGFATLGAWLTFAQIGGAIMINGQVQFDDTPSPIAHPHGGTVIALHIREGSEVAAGAPLLEFDSTSLRTERTLLMHDLLTAITQDARYQAEQDNRRDITVAEPTVSLNRNERQYLEVQISSQTEALHADLARYQAEIAQLENTLAANAIQRQNLVHERNIALTQLSNAQTQLDNQEQLSQRGLTTQANRITAQQNIANIEREISQIDTRTANLTAENGRIPLQIAQHHASRDQRISAQLAQASQARASLTTRLQALDQQIANNVITAPINGIVQDLAPRHVGAFIAPAREILRLISSSKQQTIQASLPLHKIQHAKVGGHARISFHGDPSAQEYEAEIRQISADRVVTEQGMTFYAIELAFIGEHPANLRSGMGVQVTIDTQPRRAISYLFEPIMSHLNYVFEDN